MNEWEWQLLEDKAPIDRVMVNGVEFRVGDRVRLRPHKGGDILDVALAGKIAIIESLEQDYEGQIQVADGAGRRSGQGPGNVAAAGPSILL